VTSGVRIGTPAATTRGLREPEMRQIAAWMARALEHAGDAAALAAVRDEVRALCARYPLYPERGRS
jgi:glycine hydroxymethyltransferase